jgi:UDPglucose 6-dehydrogenase
MIPYLSKKGAKIKYYDPTGKKNEFSKLKNCFFSNNIKDTCKNSDLIILHTEWDEFKSLDFKKLTLNKNFKVYDLRNLYSYKEMLKKKIKYYSIGRPAIN